MTDANRQPGDNGPDSGGGATMNPIDITIRTGNGDRKAEIQVQADVTVEELLASAKEQWALPGNYEYVLRSEQLGRQLRPTEVIGIAGVRQGDRLDIMQLSDAGAIGPRR